MIQPILPIDDIRRGLLGSRPVGANYMDQVNKRSKRMASACRVARVNKVSEKTTTSANPLRS